MLSMVLKIMAYGAVTGTYADTVNKSFGLQDKMSSLTLTNNKVNLAKLNQNTVDRFAYGQQSRISISIIYTFKPVVVWYGFISTNTIWISRFITCILIHGKIQLLHQKPELVQIEVGIAGASTPANVTRTLKGGIVGAVALSTSVGGMVDCSTDITYGQETAPSTALTPPIKPTVQSPYTFAHAELYFCRTQKLHNVKMSV